MPRREVIHKKSPDDDIRNHSKHCLALVLAWFFVLGSSMGCSTKRNDSASRFYHNLTTRYNVYYNGRAAYEQGYKELYDNVDESYTDLLLADPVTRRGARADGAEEAPIGGSFGRAVEKGRKAIREHSIRTKPKINRDDLLRNPKKKAFYNQTEFNPFLHNAWMLVGQAQFYAGRFTEAMATFSYIARLYAAQPKVRDEARVWLARCYTALDWIEEAREVLQTLPEESDIYLRSKAFSLAETELSIKGGDSVGAISHLQRAVRHEKNKAQKARLCYLLGQLHMGANQTKEARQAFGRAARLAPSYPLQFASTMRLLEIDAQADPQRAVRRLERLAKRDKNKDLLDQIHLTRGRLYLSRRDTLQAVQAFKQGVEGSTRKSFDYMLCQLHLGEIYLAQPDYLKAREAYAAAYGVMGKEHPDYEQVSKISTDLDQLVAYAEQVYEQDSLRRIAALPEEAKLAYADSIIAAYKKQAKEQERAALMAEQQGKNEALNQQSDLNSPGGRPPGVAAPSMRGNGKFYFYNPQLVSQGKDAFERKWGKRPLADDWRRRDKRITFDPEQPPLEDAALPSDTTERKAAGEEPAAGEPADSLPPDQNPLERAYYLSKLPTTPEQIAASDEIIQTALTGMAGALNERMERFSESARVYRDLLERYPEYKDRMTVYYTLYMIYQRMERPDLAEPWRLKLLSEYPADPLAEALSDPDYISKLKANIGTDARLYEEALDAYLAGDADRVQQLYREMQTAHPLSEVLPQFSFVHALSYVLQGNEDAFREQLKTLTQTYPKEQVSLLAQEMLAHLMRGRHISRGGYTGLAWDFVFAPADSIARDGTEAPYAPGLPSDPHVALLFYPASGTDVANMLRFAVESFNYSTFTDYILPVSVAPRGEGTLVTISDLPHASLAWQYVLQAYSPAGYMPLLDSTALLIAMTRDNYEKMNNGGRSMADYMAFAADSLAEAYPEVHAMIDRWIELTEQEANAREGSTPADTLRRDEPAVPITFDIDRSAALTDTVRIDRDAAVSADGQDGQKEPSPALRINNPRDLSPEEMKQMERERKALEHRQEKEREEKLKSRETQRKAEVKARREEQKAQERRRRQQLKKAEAERNAREKARRAELKQKEKERKEQLRLLEEERLRKLRERSQKQSKNR